jgi:diguanylate cyclase (GGDEF)-like protein
MFKANPAVLRRTLEQLEQAGRDHAQWLEHVLRTIVCRLPANPVDLAENAHRHCRFGQWYHGRATLGLRNQALSGAMAEEHARLHRIAARVLREATGNGPLARESFDELVAASACLRLALDALRHEIQGSLHDSDPLTGAYGRAHLLPELRERRELARRKVQQCCIAFMDLDHLKIINDTHGHAVGDLILTGAIEYVMQHLRPYDKIFRYGGDEFLLLLPGTELADAEHLIERIRQGFGKVPFVVSADGHPIHATASFGLALLDPDLVVEESIDRADKAVLLAKTMGRDRACCWNPTVSTGTALKWDPADDTAG